MKNIRALEAVGWVAALLLAAALAIVAIRGLNVKERHFVVPDVFMGTGWGLGGPPEFDLVIASIAAMKVYGPTILIGILFGFIRIEKLSALGRLWLYGVLLISAVFLLAIMHAIGSFTGYLFVLVLLGVPSLIGSTVGFFHRKLWDTVHR